MSRIASEHVAHCKSRPGLLVMGRGGRKLNLGMNADLVAPTFDTWPPPLIRGLIKAV